MILPDDLVAALVAKLNLNKTELKILGAVSGSEDIAEGDLTPPYCVVFSNFEDEAKVSVHGSPFEIPVRISVLCTSGEHQTVEQASGQAFLLAVQVIKLLQGEYNVISFNGEEHVILECTTNPLRFGVKSAAITSVIVNFQYLIDVIHEDY